MIKFYFSGAPNPMKVALFLEEAGLGYEPVSVDTRAGDQHKAEFTAVNPNAKVPVITDGDVTVFDSNAIRSIWTKRRISSCLRTPQRTAQSFCPG